jgi:WD40 repeat protein
MLSVNGPVSTFVLAWLLASTYARCPLCGQEALEKKPATAAPRLVAKEKFRAERANRIGSLKFSPNGKLLAESDVNQRISICDAFTGEQTILFKGYPKVKGPALSGVVDFSPDGRRLLGCISSEQVISAWDVESEKLLFRVGTGDKGFPFHIAFHPNGKQFAITGGRTIQFRDGETGGLLRALTPNGTIFGLVFSADGKQLACATTDRTKPIGAKDAIEIWDVESAKELKTLKGHEGTVYGICFSPCGKWIASASSDKTVRIWDTKTGETVRTMKFGSIVKKVIWSPDGKWLALGRSAGDKIISIRDAKTGDEILAIETSFVFLSDMALNSKGTLLAAAGSRKVQVWELTTPTAPPQREPPEAKKKQ